MRRVLPYRIHTLRNMYVSVQLSERSDQSWARKLGEGKGSYGTQTHRNVSRRSNVPKRRVETRPWLCQPNQTNRIRS
jgi:hypothetical protein